MNIYGDIVGIKKSVVALGFFDGVHIGHRKLIKKLVQYAKKNITYSVIITFKTAPAECFYQNVKYLTTNEQKENIISRLGVDYMFELDFNKELMNMPHSDYLKNIIYKNFEPLGIITGFNHTFGKNGLGNSDYLRQNAKKYGYSYLEIPPVKISNETVSSSLIRKYLNEGNINQANMLLGAEFEISGTVIEGNKIGRKLGFPTANIAYPEKTVQIPYGVYSCRVIFQNNQYKGIMNYGIKPTLTQKTKKAETEIHIMGFDEDLYGETIQVKIIEKIRDERKFNSLEELQAQIKEDIKKC